MNDSAVQYGLQVDTVAKSLELQAWNDTSFKSKLYYSSISPTVYLLEGTFMHDSIKMMAQKKNTGGLPLLKDKGKIKWVWW